MKFKGELRRISRGLRFRLTAGYSLFFTIILLGVSALFWERLQTVQERNEVWDEEDRRWAGEER